MHKNISTLRGAKHMASPLRGWLLWLRQIKAVGEALHSASPRSGEEQRSSGGEANEANEAKLLRSAVQSRAPTLLLRFSSPLSGEKAVIGEAIRFAVQRGGEEKQSPPRSGEVDSTKYS